MPSTPLHLILINHCYRFGIAACKANIKPSNGLPELPPNTVLYPGHLLQGRLETEEWNVPCGGTLRYVVRQLRNDPRTDAKGRVRNKENRQPKSYTI